jgi:hypothetical protein
MMNRMECVFVFYVIKKLIKNLIHVILINVLFAYKKFFLNKFLNKIFFVPQFESQVSYGSNVKSNIEGLFCDNYDRTNNLYCKRLKIICPEHSRDPKVKIYFFFLLIFQFEH